MMDPVESLPVVRASRFGARALVAVAIVVGVGLLIWFVFERPKAAERTAVQAAATTEFGETQVDIARDAARTGDRFAREQRRIEGINHGNSARILAAPGADRPISPDVAGALDASLCLRDQYRDEPECAGLRDPAA